MKQEEGIREFKTVVWSAGAGCQGNCAQKLYINEGDETRPWNRGRSYPRVLALTQYMYHPDRIITPLKRVGARGCLRRLMDATTLDLPRLLITKDDATVADAFEE